ncbi:MAG: 1,2-phenylacetyl-CoA epoxidase subunit B [Saprospiraceae bacterium]|nr:1,2-phenylacetyl-CoA epoxidase subunit B [Saprospiraceae bacterium]
MKNTVDSQGPIWEVFVQQKTGQPYRHAGSLHAFDKEMAIENARDLFTRRGESSGLWVVPAEAIIAVQPADSAPFFDPADDKVYRHPTFYQMPEGAKNI